MAKNSPMSISWTALLVVTFLLAGSFGGRLPSQAQTPVPLGDAEPGVAPGWTVECVDCPKAFRWMTDRSVHRDLEGHPHVAYGWDHLYYAWYTGTDWQYKTIDGAPGVGGFASLALTEIGEAHISYYDRVNGALKYAYWDGSSQPVITTVDGVGDVGQGTSITLDSNEVPHISYYDVTNDALKYAHWTGTAWNVTTVESGEWCGQGSSLQIDQEGEPHISYARYDEGASAYRLRYAQLYEGSWDIVTADDDGSVGLYSSLVLEGSRWAHISYYDVSNGTLKYNWLSFFGWHPDTVDNDSDAVGHHSSLALDFSGQPHISYCGYRGELRYATLPGTSWEISTVENSGAAYGCPFTSLYVLNGDYPPHITYLHVPSGELRYAHKDAQGWRSDPVDSGNLVGLGSSLAVDDDGDPHISYDSMYGEDLKYATWDGEGWDLAIVDKTDVSFSRGSLALDDDGYPHVAYVGRRYQPSLSYYLDLKYAYQDAQGWRTTTVSTTVEPCEVSLDLDGDGYPHISFCGQSGIAYARQDAQGWYDEMVDGTISIPWFSQPSLAVDGDGTPHISYHHSDGEGLKYATLDGGSWDISRVDAGGAPSLALDEDGDPHISYHDGTNEVLKYASWNNGGWDVSVVDSHGKVGWSSSLVLDRNDLPHISYYDIANKDLKYATWDGTGSQVTAVAEWQITTVDSEEWVGLDTSLDLDAWGNRHISYHDGALGDLRYAFYANQAPIADAGSAQSVMPGDPVTLDGSGSTDPDGDLPLAFGWQQTGGTPVSLSNPSAAEPSFTAPEEDTVLVFALTVTDSLGMEGEPDTVRTTVGAHRVYLPVMMRNLE